MTCTGVSPAMPAGVELVRTTSVFDQTTVPAGLLKAHRIAAGTWGQLVVHSGTVEFVFEDQSANVVTLSQGESIVIPPEKAHHIALLQPATFCVEFYR